MNERVWLGLMGEQLVQSSAVIALVWILARWVCARRPHWAHVLWMVALAKCLVPPLWASEFGAFSWIDARHGTVVAQTSADVSRGVSVPVIGGAAAGEPEIGPPASLSQTQGFAWAKLVLGIWIAGIAVTLGVAGIRSAILRRRVKRRLVATPAGVADMFEQISGELCAKVRARLAVVGDDFGPAVFGVIQPTLVLPEKLIASQVDLAPAIAHELSHLRRWDHWVAGLQIAAAALWWFNPLVWWMNREIERARESSCDEEVLERTGCRRQDYAQMLLDVVRWKKESAWPALGIGAVDAAGRRMEHIMDEGARPHGRTPLLGWAAAAMMALALLPGAALERMQPNMAMAQTSSAGEAAQGGEIHFTGCVKDKSTGRGIAGATVTLHREIAREPELWDDIGEPQRILTDAQGKFEFTVTAAEAGNKYFCLATEVSHPHYAALLSDGEGISSVLKERERGQRPWFEDLEMVAGKEMSGIVLNPDKTPAVNCRVEYASFVAKENEIGLARGTNISMGTVTTDERGRFRFVAIAKMSEGVFQTYSDHFAATATRVNPQTSDLGMVQLEKGIWIIGRVVDENGKGVSNAKIRVRSDADPLAPYGAMERTAPTDGEGNYKLQPMPPGIYRVSVEEDDRYLPVYLTLRAAEDTEKVEFKPTPVNLIDVKFVDSAGKPSTLRNRIGVSAWKGSLWFNGPFKGNGAETEIQFPRGMEKIQLQILGREDYTMLWRLEPDGPWRGWMDTQLPAPAAQRTDITVVQYHAPKLTVRGLDADGNTIGKPAIVYDDPSLHLPAGHGWVEGITGDVGFDHNPDGSWVSSAMMLPDKSFTLSVVADGYRPITQKLMLREAEQREISVRLTKQ